MSEKRNLLQIIKNGQKNYRETVWPGTDEKILLRPPTEQDHLDASLGADMLYNSKKVGVHSANLTAYTADVSTRMLFKCILDPETEKPVFSSLNEFRSVLTPEIKDILEDEWDEFCDAVSPMPERLNDEEFDNLMQNLKKKPEEIIGSVSSIFTARRLILTLVRQLTI